MRGITLKRLLSVSILVLAFSAPARGEDKAKTAEGEWQCREDAQESTFFPGIQAAARRINRDVCDAVTLPTGRAVGAAIARDDLAVFGALVKEEANRRLGEVRLEKMDQQLDYFETTLKEGRLYPRFLVQKGAGGPADPKHFYYFTSNQQNQGTLTASDDARCTQRPDLNAPCLAVLKDLDQAIYPYQRNVNAYNAHQTKVKLSLLSKEWDAYFDSARAQSFADVAATTLLERRHFEKRYLVGPPARQWFVLHPNVVMEYAEGAPAGDKLKPALIVEWIGVNWWRDSLLRIPVGISLATLYADRPGVKGVGHGVTLYLDNKYAIGYAYHDGESGVYFSYDLLKLFEDKQKQAERYRDLIRK